MTSLQRHTPRVTDFLSLTSSTVARIRADPGRGQLKPWSAERGLLMGSRPRGTAAGVHLRGRRRLSGTSRSPWTQLPTSVSEPMAIGALDRLGGGNGEELPSDGRDGPSASGPGWRSTDLPGTARDLRAAARARRVLRRQPTADTPDRTFARSRWQTHSTGSLSGLSLRLPSTAASVRARGQRRSIARASGARPGEVRGQPRRAS